MKKDHTMIVYQTKTGAIELKEDASAETMWATLQQIANLFDTDKSGISRHIKNIFDSKELDSKATVAIFATVQKEGKRQVYRDIEYFNLDMIISVGYRVNSRKATIFRQWATKTLRSHIIDGYTINKKRLADGNKRSGAFAFIWFLKQAGILNPARLTAEALTALTLFVAESNAKDKDKMTGLVLLLLN